MMEINIILMVSLPLDLNLLLDKNTIIFDQNDATASKHPISFRQLKMELMLMVNQLIILALQMVTKLVKVNIQIILMMK